MWSIDVLLGLEIQNFKKRLYEVAARDTSSDPDSWHESNPLWGHCAIAAVLFQDFFDGTLKNARVQLDGEISHSHYWNVLPSGQEVDVTWEQFVDVPACLIGVTERKQREYVLSFPETKRRYELLKQRYQAEG